jgi:hypothetical protein
MSRLMWFGLVACGFVLLAAHDARAEWPCGDNTHYRVVHTPKGDQPIAILAANDQPIYGDFTFVELNGDNRQDILFRSACIRGPIDSVRLHQAYASCGRARDGVEEFVKVFEQEELCSSDVTLSAATRQTTSSGLQWRDLQLTRTTPGKRCEQAIVPLQFDGDRYRPGAGTTRPCPKK